MKTPLVTFKEEIQKQLMEGATLQQVSEKYGVSRERVRQVADPDGIIRRIKQMRRQEAKAAIAKDKVSNPSPRELERECLFTRVAYDWNKGVSLLELTAKYGYRSLNSFHHAVIRVMQNAGRINKRKRFGR